MCIRDSPTGGHADDACNWNANDKHSTTIVRQDAQSALSVSYTHLWDDNSICSNIYHEIYHIRNDVNSETDWDSKLQNLNSIR